MHKPEDCMAHQPIVKIIRTQRKGNVGPAMHAALSTFIIKQAKRCTCGIHRDLYLEAP